MVERQDDVAVDRLTSILVSVGLIEPPGAGDPTRLRQPLFWRVPPPETRPELTQRYKLRECIAREEQADLVRLLRRAYNVEDDKSALQLATDFELPWVSLYGAPEAKRGRPPALSSDTYMALLADALVAQRSAATVLTNTDLLQILQKKSPFRRRWGGRKLSNLVAWHASAKDPEKNTHLERVSACVSEEERSRALQALIDRFGVFAFTPEQDPVQAARLPKRPSHRVSD